jgi:hypothetical protein
VLVQEALTTAEKSQDALLCDQLHEFQQRVTDEIDNLNEQFAETRMP